MSDSPRTDLAAHLGALRDLSGRSLRELERDTGISSSSLSRYFAGQTVPPWDVVLALCKLVRRDPRPLRPIWKQASELPAAPRPRPARSARNDLPRDVPDFTGRTAELATVLTIVGDVGAVAIDGMAGVGKTAVAVHAAHLLAPDYPDAQLYLDLHGFTPGHEPVEPGAALRRLLGALELPPGRIPDGTEQRAARWRSELAGRRVVVLLDNAAGAEHVRSLLPGAGGSVVIVTSRNRLVGLDGVPPVSLDVLPPEDAATLFARASGRTAAEPVDEVLRLCGHLPLAIRVAAARLRHRPGWTVEVLTERLRAGTEQVDSAFAMSLRQLDREQRRIFPLLGLVPGTDFDDRLAAAVAEVRRADARATLEDLVDAHLVQQPHPGRYRLHDLVRAFALGAAEAETPEAERRAAVVRVLDHYLRTASAAAEAMPDVWRNPVAVDGGERFDSAADALAWYDREYGNLVAAIDRAAEIGANEQLSRLPSLLRPYFFRRSGTAEESRLLALAVQAAEGTDLYDTARADLAFARYTAGRLEEAGAVYAELGDARDPELAASVALRYGYLRQDLGDAEHALELFRQASDLFDAVGNEQGVAHAVAFKGWAALQLGRNEDAERAARTSLRTASSVTALVTLGTAIAGDRPEEAIAHLREALRVARADDHRQNQVWSLNYLAVALRHAGRFEEALDNHREALGLLDELGEAQWAVNFLNSYAETCRAAGLRDETTRAFRQALALARELGYAHEEKVASAALADSP